MGAHPLVLALLASLTIGTIAAGEPPTSNPAPDPPASAAEPAGGEPLALEVGTDGEQSAYVLATRSPYGYAPEASPGVQVWVSGDGGESFRSVSPTDAGEPAFLPGEPETALAVDGEGIAYVAQRADPGVQVLRGGEAANDSGGLWWTRVETQPRELLAATGEGWFAMANHRGGNESEGWISVHRAPTGPDLPGGQSYAIWEEPGGSALALADDGLVLLAHTDGEDRVALYEFGDGGPPTSGPAVEAHRRGEIPREGADAIGTPSLAVDERGRIYLAWAERTDETVHVRVLEETRTGWSQRFHAQAAGPCLPSLASTSLEEGAIFAYREQGCADDREPRVVRVIPDGGHALERVTRQRILPLQSKTCPAPTTCQTSVGASALGVGTVSGDRVLVAWPSGEDEVALGFAAPRQSPPHTSVQAPVEAPAGGSAPSMLEALAALVVSGAAVALLAIPNGRQPPILLPLYSRTPDDELLENERRRAIRELVEERPGIHFAELRRRLEVTPGNLEHHVSKLLDAGLLTDRRLGGYRCFFLPGRLDPAVERGLSTVKAPAAREILDALGAARARGLRTLARTVDRAPSTVAHHLAKLEDSGLVERGNGDATTGIRLTDLGDRVLRRLPER